MVWKQEEFNDFILKNGVIGFFKKPLRLKSGRLSNWYVNWRNIAEDVYLIDELVDFILKFVEKKKLKPDCFYGVPEGATKMGILTQYKWAKNQKIRKGKYILSMGRAKPKDHGDPKDKYFLGVPEGRIIILEDVTTTGGSILSSIDKILEINAEIVAAIGLTNRNELRSDQKSVKDAIAEKGVKYYAMSNALELLPKLNPPEDIAVEIREYFTKYGIKRINL
ncbi:MAG: hypothetical protein GF353_03380 [Candidatus Lokiarchaeota archaeon]|nr:hypothetical protein [Candidatus Lokiarchaeota archaeon]